MSHIVFLINTLYDLWWGPTGILCGVLRGSCVGSYGDLVCGLTGLLDGSFRVIGWVLQGYWMGLSGLLDGSFRVIGWVLQGNLLICLLLSLIVVFRNGLFRDLHGPFYCKTYISRNEWDINI